MQFIERSVLGVRSAVWTLESPQMGFRVMLFPMIHVAQPSFYAEVSKRLSQCDIILCEGVSSKFSKRLAQAYLQLTRNPRLGLVAQHEMALDHVKERLVLADIEGAHFDESWEDLSFFNRFVFPVAAYFFGLYLRFFGTRRLMARQINSQMLESRDDLLKDDDTQELDNILLEHRDQHLISVIDDQIAKLGDAKQTIGIVYGAAHMRAVARHLVRNHGCRTLDGEWITVFDL
ncbi:hypothetical protein MWU53_01270 [Aliiroseovarius sp. S1123]|jgi:hypothetical protein|uniref:hypothetical protein n=1 Tax=unclassified Aliiroseovarius TaxID=2623558 RepID=UPI001FF2C63C|nr:hypothetical protein [Aliiroseovarius sp. S1123]MCK0169679.1 hypothetical protein [Aliiroseovarius sp. S1123]